MLDLYTQLMNEYESAYGPDQTEWPLDAQDAFLVWAKLERVQRCKHDLLEFAIEYFSEARNPGNDGNWDSFDLKRKEDAAEFHREITDIMNEVSADKKNAKVAVAAPRSHAKSSYLTKAFPVHEIVYRLRKYIIIISETPKVSEGNMEWIRGQMKHNAKLRADFGPLLSPKDQANPKDNGGAFIAWTENEDGTRKQLALVEAASTGQALRGRSWNGSRPDLIICDDLEDARPGGNASTPEQRDNLRDWFTQTVMPLGDPKGKKTAFVVMGTTVHYDSLLMEILHRRSDFESRIYRAVISWPERMDLWEECRKIYMDRDNLNRKQDADDFYERNKEEMLKGAEVLWPEVKPLYELMKWKWDNGSKAFNTEYMNNPIDEESMIFNPDNFTYWDDKRTKQSLLEIDKKIVTMGIDFAMGKERGDYSAIAVNIHEVDYDIDNIVEAYGERIKPDEFLEVIISYALEYEPDVIACEAQAAQEFFADTLYSKLVAVGYPAHTRLKKIYQRGRKEMRIEAMQPRIENGAIRFSRQHLLLIEQFERYGTGGHDDLLDACEMAITARKSNYGVIRMARRRLYSRR